MDVDILPQKYTGATFLHGAIAIDGEMDYYGVGKLTTIEKFSAIEFKCKWEPYITRNEHVIVYFEFPNQTSYLVLAVDDFIDNVKVVW